MSKIRLRVLVIDPDDSSSELLVETLTRSPYVLSVQRVQSLDEARMILRKEPINTIYVDLLSLGLDTASEFVFDVRRDFPDRVFVLYVDFKQVEKIQDQFYKGERERFSHYFKLDKLSPMAVFSDKVALTVEQCQGDLLWYSRAKQVAEGLGRASSYVKSTEIKETVSDIKKDASLLSKGETRNKIIENTERLDSQVKQLHDKIEEEISAIRKIIGATESVQDWKLLISDITRLKVEHVPREVFDSKLEALSTKIEAFEKIEKAYERLSSEQKKVLEQQSSFLNWIKYSIILVPIAVACVPIIETLIRHFLGP